MKISFNGLCFMKESDALIEIIVLKLNHSLLILVYFSGFWCFESVNSIY